MCIKPAIPAEAHDRGMVDKYNRVLVVLHWLLAVAIVFALAMGTLSLQHIPNSSPDKVFALRGHMVAGLAILALTLVRLAVRLGSAKPPRASLAAALGHYGLYALVILMAASGIGIALATGLPGIVFGGSGAPLPETFAGIAPRTAHGIVAKLLMALIAVHLLAAAYHHFVRRDGLLRRMGW
jgi:cytochrome b561